MTKENIDKEKLKERLKTYSPAIAGVAGGLGTSGVSLAASSLKKLIDSTSKYKLTPEKAGNVINPDAPIGMTANSPHTLERFYSKASEVGENMKVGDDAGTKISIMADKKSSIQRLKDGKYIIRANNLENFAHELGHFKTYDKLDKTKVGSILRKYMTARKLMPAYLAGSSLAVAALTDRDTSDSLLAATALPLAPILADEAIASYRGVKSLPSGKAKAALASLLGLGTYLSAAATPFVIGKIKQKILKDNT